MENARTAWVGVQTPSYQQPEDAAASGRGEGQGLTSRPRQIPAWGCPSSPGPSPSGQHRLLPTLRDTGGHVDSGKDRWAGDGTRAIRHLREGQDSRARPASHGLDVPPP